MQSNPKEKGLLNFDEETQQLQNRVNSLRSWNQDQTWPDFTDEALISTAGKWLLPYLSPIRKSEDLFKLDLKQILLTLLDFGQQKLLNELVPEKITVPSGSSIPIHYGDSGENPILAVRLQEVFGWIETPRINAGKVPLLLHLLSPGFKPVQVTSDLRSFWKNTYFEVKKDLKRRYPKTLVARGPVAGCCSTRRQKKINFALL
jgi:ATP-dependent helicase HrpB